MACRLPYRYSRRPYGAAAGAARGVPLHAHSADARFVADHRHPHLLPGGGAQSRAHPGQVPGDGAAPRGARRGGGDGVAHFGFDGGRYKPFIGIRRCGGNVFAAFRGLLFHKTRGNPFGYALLVRLHPDGKEPFLFAAVHGKRAVGGYAR